MAGDRCLSICEMELFCIPEFGSCYSGQATIVIPAKFVPEGFKRGAGIQKNWFTHRTPALD